MSGLKYAELDCLIEYRRLIEEESMAPEDARQILPNATKTNITMTVNLRELMHICSLRLCNRASLEIRELFQAIKKEVEQKEEKLAGLLVPTCEILQYCPEHKGCGRKPKLEEIINK
jgi:thymidylate synthase (FAD)